MADRKLRPNGGAKERAWSLPPLAETKQQILALRFMVSRSSHRICVSNSASTPDKIAIASLSANWTKVQPGESGIKRWDCA